MSVAYRYTIVEPASRVVVVAVPLGHHAVICKLVISRATGISFAILTFAFLPSFSRDSETHVENGIFKLNFF